VSKIAVCGAAKIVSCRVAWLSALYRPSIHSSTGAYMNRNPALIAATLLALLAVNQTHAATEDEEKKACRSDAMHFCSADIPDKQKITACMEQHVSELSPACQKMFKKGGGSSDDDSDSN
jgi:hypothetical protein